MSSVALRNGLRAVTKRHRPFVFESALLPRTDHQVVESINTLDQQAVVRFHQVVNWPRDRQHLHPCFLHTVAFHQHMQLMLHDEFPFALVGTVHLSNRIMQSNAVTLKAQGVMSSHISQYNRHPRGITFCVNSEFSSEGQVIWTDRSEFLALDKAIKPTSGRKPTSSESPSIEGVADWPCPENIGRRYAKAAGDYNPIHLHALTAKVFGFNRAIAHGMWTKAMCLSHLLDNDDHQLDCKVKFVRPVLLPNHAVLQVQQATEQATHFTVLDKASTKVSLQGQLKR